MRCFTEATSGPRLLSAVRSSTDFLDHTPTGLCLPEARFQKACAITKPQSGPGPLPVCPNSAPPATGRGAVLGVQFIEMWEKPSPLTGLLRPMLVLPTWTYVPVSTHSISVSLQHNLQKHGARKQQHRSTPRSRCPSWEEPHLESPLPSDLTREPPPAPERDWAWQAQPGGASAQWQDPPRPRKQSPTP